MVLRRPQVPPTDPSWYSMSARGPQGPRSPPGGRGAPPDTPCARRTSSGLQRHEVVEQPGRIPHAGGQVPGLSWTRYSAGALPAGISTAALLLASSGTPPLSPVLHHCE